MGVHSSDLIKLLLFKRTVIHLGSVWADLLPTVVALAVYYCFADFVLLSQVFYYSRLAKRQATNEVERRYSHPHQINPDAVVSNDPTQPLLPRRGSTSTQSITYRRQSISRRRDSLSALMEKKPSTRTVVTRNILSIAGTCLAGTLGWFVAWKAGAWKARDGSAGGTPEELGAELLGYISAVLYLGARIPQIIQNYQKKSCEGKMNCHRHRKTFCSSFNRTFNPLFHAFTTRKSFLRSRGMFKFALNKSY